MIIMHYILLGSFISSSIAFCISRNADKIAVENEMRNKATNKGGK